MAKNTWVGKYYVNAKGQRVKSSDAKPTVSQSGNTYTYKSSTLNIKLERKSVHGISYWAAHIKNRRSQTAEICTFQRNLRRGTSDYFLSSILQWRNHWGKRQCF